MAKTSVNHMLTHCVLVSLLLRLLVLAAECASLQPFTEDEQNNLSNEILPDAEFDDYKAHSHNIAESDYNMNAELEDESDDDEFCEWQHCDKDLREPRGIAKYFDFPFIHKFMRNLNPFRKTRREMNFYLFRREFPDCGREITIEDTAADILQAGFNASQPTRIIIHGWMSQSRGSFNRDVKNAYLGNGDFNVIVTDWSASASNVNYFAVVKLIEGFGAQVARFTQHLQRSVGANYADMYLIGHSLGAQIAGAAGKLIKPALYNTIFALDPAGPKFRHRSIEFRIDPTDARYVESIQTSGNLGFLEPTGNATFYPNYGLYQRKCFYVGCSHIRAYKMFAESITTKMGFWGTRCNRRQPKWECNETTSQLYRMGGEPAQPKSGIYYVKTATSSPFALGRLGLFVET